jgi:hypothetical protein
MPSCAGHDVALGQGRLARKIAYFKCVLLANLFLFVAIRKSDGFYYDVLHLPDGSTPLKVW